MDKEWAQEVAKDAAAKTGKEATEAVSQAGAKVQPTLDQGKSMVHDLASRVSETGRQGMDRASEFIERVAPQAKEVANNLYGQGSQSQEYIRQYVVQQPLTALLIAGGIGYLLGYLTHRP